MSETFSHAFIGWVVGQVVLHAGLAISIAIGWAARQP